MKIADIKTYVVGNPPPHYEGSNWVFLKITTDDGIEGLGGILEAKKTAGMGEAYYAQSIFPLAP